MGLKILQGGRIRLTAIGKAAETRLAGAPVELASGKIQTSAAGAVTPTYIAIKDAVLTNPKGDSVEIAGKEQSYLAGEAVVEITGADLLASGYTPAEGDTVYASSAAAGQYDATAGIKMGKAIAGTTATKIVLLYLPAAQV